MCEEQSYDYVPADLDSKLGLAINGKIPIDLPPENRTNQMLHPPDLSGICASAALFGSEFLIFYEF